MSEEPMVTAPAPEAGAPQEPPKKKPTGKKHRKGHPIRTAIVIVAVLALLGVGGYFLWNFLNQTQEVNSEMQTTMAMWGSIQSTVQGSGSARAKESTFITLQNAGIVQKVYVTEGQMVMEGEPLYEIVSPAAQEAYEAALGRVEGAEKALQSRYDELDKAQSQLLVLRQEYQDLLEVRANTWEARFVKAPFSGQLQDTLTLQPGADLGAGTRVATLVDDSKFRIPFYFSYAYEGKLWVGQRAEVTVRSSTDPIPGRVEEITMVRRVSPEGTVLFEALVVVDNPGTLTKGLTASVSLTGADGVPIYPYDTGELDYYRTADILTHTTGQVISTGLRDYMDVAEGQTVLTLSEEDFSDRLAAKSEQIKAQEEAVEDFSATIEEARAAVDEAKEKAEEAAQALEDFSAAAPMSGTVTSCTLYEGAEVKSGDTVITIVNNATMVVTINVDDRNIAYVKPGMMVELQSNWGGGGMFFGTVTKIDMSLSGDSMGSGMTNYPVTLEVDNYDGSLLEGMWLSYSFVTSQSDNCILVPMQSVKYVSTEDGDTAAVVFIQAEEKPDNAVTLPEDSGDSYGYGYGYGGARTYPSEEDGFYPVPVTTGLSDNYNVEIVEGLQGDEIIFVSYFVSQAWG